MAALEHSDRLCSISLHVTDSMWAAKMATVLKKPFPLLKRFLFWSVVTNVPALPDAFLGGSAPCLQEIILNGIPFPALPTLLLTTSNLVKLSLHDIPPTSYFPPETMVVCLDVLPLLERLDIGFYDSDPHPDQIRPPPTTRSVLPALTSFGFQGAFEYLEDFVTQIDGPQLDEINISYLNPDGVPQQLSEFINRSVGPKSTPSGRADIIFHYSYVTFSIYRRANYPGSDRRPLKTTICSNEHLEWSLPELADDLCRFPATAILYTIVHLKLEVQDDDEYCVDFAHGADWLSLFSQFLAMKILDVSGRLAEPVAMELKRITMEMVAGVFPSLRLIFIEGQPASSVETIVAARRLPDRPVTFVETKAEFEEMLKFYATVSE
jgi:hypothetical protein